MRRMYLLCLLGTLAAAGCNSDRPVAYEYDEYEAFLRSVGCNNGDPDCVARHSAQYASGIGYHTSERYFSGGASGGYIGADGQYYAGDAIPSIGADGTSGVLYAGGNGGRSGGARYVSLDGKPVKEVKFSTPAGNDLKLETAEYVLQIDGVPNKRYNYYVWAGDKQYTDDPDLIIEDGTAAILVEE